MICEIQLLLQLISKQNDLCIDVYHYGIECLSNRLQWEPCSVMFKVISDIMAHWYDIWNKYNRYCNLFLEWKQNDLCIRKQSLWNCNCYCNEFLQCKDLCINVSHKHLLWNKMS